MNTQERSPAEERLLDAALHQVLQASGAAAPPSGLRRAWFAAAALLGIAVVVGSLVLRRAPVVVPAAQDPAPAQEPTVEPQLPAAVLARTLDELAALPVDTPNLECALPSPKDLAQLQRFTALRRLRLIREPFATGGAGPSPPEFWLDPQPELLAPLAALPELRELVWPTAMRVEGKHLAPLVGAPQLRSMSFTGDRLVLNAGLVDALAALPRLGELRFVLVPMRSDFLERLARLPLQRLLFLGCPGMDEAALAALETMPSLRGLEVTDQHGGTAGLGGGASYKLGRLTAASFASLGKMPALRELGLDESEISEELLQLLPAKLQKLDLGSRAVTFGVGTAVRRLGDLRDLTLGAGSGLEAADRTASVIGTLRLLRLEYRGAPTAALLRAIGEQPQLRELSLQIYDAIDLGPLAQAPGLRSLTLMPGERKYRPELEALEPLTKCRHLQRLHLINYGLDPAEVRSLLGDKVQLEIEETLWGRVVEVERKSR